MDPLEQVQDCTDLPHQITFPAHIEQGKMGLRHWFSNWEARLPREARTILRGGASVSHNISLQHNPFNYIINQSVSCKIE